MLDFLTRLAARLKPHTATNLVALAGIVAVIILANRWGLY